MIVLAAWILIAPGIWAEPNELIGQTAYISCMETGNALACGPVRSEAIRQDAENRFKLLFADLSAGKVRSQRALNTYLAKYKLALKPQ